jgi:hypothetical protein
MTGTTAGFLKKSGQDTYSVDTNTYVVANTAITGATKTKITFDAKGLVTAGADLTASDIPALDAAKITTGTFDAARIPSLAYIVRTGSRTAGQVPTWANADGGSLNNGYGVTTNLSTSAASTELARADAIKAYVDSRLDANDAMQYKGTLGTGGTITALPTTYSAG